LQTNALAEGKNSKIPKFISSNQGTRDNDFFSFFLARKNNSSIFALPFRGNNEDDNRNHQCS
jgi:hypothetical protein